MKENQPARVNLFDTKVFWSIISKKLNKALKRDGKFLPEDILTRLSNGTAQLWEVGDFRSILVTEIVVYPRKKVLNLFIAEGVLEDKKHIDAILEWGREMGCQSVEITGRKGWAKVLGFKEINTIAGKEL